MDSSAVRLALGVFRAGFARSDSQRDMREIERGDECRQRMMMFAPSSQLQDQPDVTKKLYIWGCKRSHEHINTEPLALGSVRALTTAGSTVRVVLANFAYLKRYLEKTDFEKEKKEPVNMQRLRKTLGSMTPTLSEYLGGNDVRLWHTTIGAGDVLFVPQGWLVAEQCTSMVATGIMASVPTQYSESLGALIALMAGRATTGPIAQTLDIMKKVYEDAIKERPRNYAGTLSAELLETHLAHSIHAAAGDASGSVVEVATAEVSPDVADRGASVHTSVPPAFEAGQDAQAAQPAQIAEQSSKTGAGAEGAEREPQSHGEDAKLAIHACAWRMAGRPVLPSCHAEFLFQILFI